MRKISFTITFDDNLKTNSVLFFIADLNLIYQAVNLIALHLNCCIASFYINKNQIIQRSCTQWNCTYKTFTVPCEKSNTVSFASSMVKNIVVFPALSKFAVKLIC